MKKLLCLLVCGAATSIHVPAQTAVVPAAASSKKPAVKRVQSAGEQAFNANCGRCHNAPEQLPPRITGTVLQHMRVRASLSAADEKALLEYLAP